MCDVLLCLMPMPTAYCFCSTLYQRLEISTQVAVYVCKQLHFVLFQPLRIQGKTIFSVSVCILFCLLGLYCNIDKDRVVERRLILSLSVSVSCSRQYLPFSSLSNLRTQFQLRHTYKYSILPLFIAILCVPTTTILERKRKKGLLFARIMYAICYAAATSLFLFL